MPKYARPLKDTSSHVHRFSHFTSVAAASSSTSIDNLNRTFETSCGVAVGSVSGMNIFSSQV